MKLNMMAGLATSAALMLAAGNATACVGDACLVDEFGTNMVLYFDDTTGWKGTDPIGTFVGYLEAPPEFSSTVVCPLSGEYVVLDVVGDLKDIRAGLFSNCWCGEGGNPAKRAMALTYDAASDEVVYVDSLSSAHAFRCDARTEVFPEFAIGDLPVIPPSNSSSTPEFATSTALF